MNLHTNPGVRAEQRAHTMTFGTQILEEGVRFRLWAPLVNTVELRIEGGTAPVELPMAPLEGGWFEVEVASLGPGTLYRFLLPDGTAVPDPASRYQPADVHGPSEVIDPLAFIWSDGEWRGRPWHEAVFYELHVGSFTPEGTFRAVIDKLDDLVALGITAIQLMPLADFQGRWNWGYDGVLPFAPDASYGRPEDLKALVDAAHARRLMVFLDVVYNHFGPDGNYMGLYAPLTTSRHQTPWGDAVNFDDTGSEMVREFVIANACYWLVEFHLDGLRFDAVNAIEDASPRHVLDELVERVQGATAGRDVHLVLENAYNEAGWLKRANDGRPTFYTAQWADDIHHGLHCAATGESQGYYADFFGHPERTARALAEGFAFQGEYSTHDRIYRGEPSDHLPATAFVSYVQNHDQIGNRPQGERLTAIASRQAVRSLAAINLLSPQVPLLFMGEEWGTRRPFHFFSDVSADLADQIRQSRREEFGFTDEGPRLPDPMAESTFLASRLDWDERRTPPHADMLQLYTTLIILRRREIVPRLAGMDGYAGRYELIGDGAFKVWWRLAEGAVLTMIANLSPEPLDRTDIWDAGRHLWLEGSAGSTTLDPWCVVFSLRDPPGADIR